MYNIFYYILSSYKYKIFLAKANANPNAQSFLPSKQYKSHNNTFHYRVILWLENKDSFISCSLNSMYKYDLFLILASKKSEGWLARVQI